MAFFSDLIESGLNRLLMLGLIYLTAPLPELWWYDGEKDHRGISPEPEDILMERANSFVDYLRKENVHSTAIVSHGNFIRAVTGIKPQNCEVIAFDPYQS